MKKILFWGVLIVLSACTSMPKSDLYSLDVEKDYPEMEMILQDCWGVDYVQLETDSTFLLSSSAPWYASESRVGFMDNKTGNILFFDAETGRKDFCINRKGAGPEEYLGVGGLVMDEKNGEVIVWSNWEGVLVVYDIQGRFLRKLPLPLVQKGEMADVMSMEDVGDSRLLCFSGVPLGQSYGLCYFMDKKTGERALVDSIAGADFISPILMEEVDGVIRAVSPNLSPVVKSGAGFVYASHSRDTVYRISPTGGMAPFLVRTPSVKVTKPHVFLQYENETHEWIFLSAVKLAFDFRREEGLDVVKYGIRKSDGEIFKLKFINADYEGGSASVASPNGFYLGTDGLLNALDEGRLKGRLKELAEQLGPDDNGVLMRLR